MDDFTEKMMLDKWPGNIRDAMDDVDSLKSKLQGMYNELVMLSAMRQKKDRTPPAPQEPP